MQYGLKAVWSIPYVPVAFFPSLKQNFIAYRSSSRPDWIFEIHLLWLSGFSRVYSNFCCSCSLEPEIIKIGQSSHKMYSNNILNFQESTTILNAHTNKFCKPIVCTLYLLLMYIRLFMSSCLCCSSCVRLCVSSSIFFLFGPSVWLLLLSILRSHKRNLQRRLPMYLLLRLDFYSIIWLWEVFLFWGTLFS